MKQRARKTRARRWPASGASPVRLEQVVPEGRHHLAAYVVPAEGGRYIGYAKACASRPASPWETPDALFKMASQPCVHPQQALEQALAVARLRLALINAQDGEGVADSEFIVL
jgi:uncharacterized protein YcaQ